MFCTVPAALSTLQYTAGPRTPMPQSYLGSDDVIFPDVSTPEWAAFYDRVALPMMQGQAELAHATARPASRS
jgi:hypothetical protein